KKKQTGDGSLTTGSNDPTAIDQAPLTRRVTRFHKIVAALRIPQVLLSARVSPTERPDRTQRFPENHQIFARCRPSGRNRCSASAEAFPACCRAGSGHRRTRRCSYQRFSVSVAFFDHFSKIADRQNNLM